MKRILNTLTSIATAAAVAFVVYSCKSTVGTEKFDASQMPVQTVENMSIVQSENGILQMRMMADIMERFETDSLSYELFPKGIKVYAYNEEGKLETQITSNEARHLKFKDGRETWQAYGNVVINNFLKREVMETDTLYWDRKNEKFYTNCYVKMFSPDGFMQGYGMESDQRARESEIKMPFNNYMFIEQDTVSVYIDTANFIGPLLKK